MTFSSAWLSAIAALAILCLLSSWISVHAQSPTFSPTVSGWTTVPLPSSSSGGYNLVAVSEGGAYYAATPSTGYLVFYNSLTNYVKNSGYFATWTDLTMSANGAIIVAIGNDQVLYSTDYGQSSLIKATIDTTLSSADLMFCAMNGDATVVLIAQAAAEVTSYSLAIYVRASGTAFAPVFTILTTFPAIPSPDYLIGLGVDSTGLILTVVTNEGRVYRSMNQGVSWTMSGSGAPVVPSTPVIYFSAAQYDDATSLIAVSGSNVNVSLSSNNGSSWSLSSDVSALSSQGVSRWYTVASSYSGQYAIASSNAAVYLSSDSGSTWTYSLAVPTTGSPIVGVATDPTGMFCASVMSTSNSLYLYQVANVPTFMPTISSAPTYSMRPSYPATLSPTKMPSLAPTVSPTVMSMPLSFQSVAPTVSLALDLITTDYTGTTVFAASTSYASLYVSTDYGYNWVQANASAKSTDGTPQAFTGIALSPNGQVFLAFRSSSPFSLLKTSSPQGVWTQLSGGLPAGLSAISSVACDFTGEHIVVVSASTTTTQGVTPVYMALSSDGGRTFAPLFGVPEPCVSVVIDANATAIAATTATGKVYLSSDSGATFGTPVQVIPSGSTSVTNQIVSSYLPTSGTSGDQYLYLPLQNKLSYVYRSGDYGQSWAKDTIVSSSYYPVSDMSVSAEGERVVIANGQSLFLSTDYGVSWETVFTTYSQTEGVAVSGDGLSVYLCTTTAGVYAYHNESIATGPPSPSPSFAPTISPAPTTTAAPTNAWTQIPLPSVDLSGYTMVATSDGGTFIVAAPAVEGPLAYYFASTGQTAQTDANVTHEWTDLCMSQDGSSVVVLGASEVFYANDFSLSLSKASFNTSLGYSSVNRCAMSPSASVLYVLQSVMSNELNFTVAAYVRPSSASSFVPVLTPIGFPGFAYPFYAVDIAVDATGLVVAVMGSDGIVFLSTDGGLDWSLPQSEELSLSPYTFFMSPSGNGQNMIAVSLGASYVALSMSQGVNWTYSSAGLLDYSPLNGTTDATVNTPIGYHSVAGSSTGQFLVLASDDAVYLSSDYGVTWTYSTHIVTVTTTSSTSPTSSAVATDSTGGLAVYVSEECACLYIYGVVAPSASPTLSPTASSNSNSSNGGLSAGAVAGVVIGTLALVALLVSVLGVYFLGWTMFGLISPKTSSSTVTGKLLVQPVGDTRSSDVELNHGRHSATSALSTTENPMLKGKIRKPAGDTR